MCVWPTGVGLVFPVSRNMGGREVVLEKQLATQPQLGQAP